MPAASVGDLVRRQQRAHLGQHSCQKTWGQKQKSQWFTFKMEGFIPASSSTWQQLPYFLIQSHHFNNWSLEKRQVSQNASAPICQAHAGVAVPSAGCRFSWRGWMELVDLGAWQEAIWMVSGFLDSQRFVVEQQQTLMNFLCKPLSCNC